MGCTRRFGTVGCVCQGTLQPADFVQPAILVHSGSHGNSNRHDFPGSPAISHTSILWIALTILRHFVSGFSRFTACSDHSRAGSQQELGDDGITWLSAWTSHQKGTCHAWFQPQDPAYPIRSACTGTAVVRSSYSSTVLTPFIIAVLIVYYCTVYDSAERMVFWRTDRS